MPSHIHVVGLLTGVGQRLQRLASFMATEQVVQQKDAQMAALKTQLSDTHKRIEEAADKAAAAQELKSLHDKVTCIAHEMYRRTLS